MLHHIKKLFGIKPTVVEAEVPYKVETLAVSPVANQATQAVVKSIAPAKQPAAKKVPAKKATAAKKTRGPKASK